jgi:hypothetical protein
MRVTMTGRTRNNRIYVFRVQQHGNPAIVAQLPNYSESALRPVALRPRLSPGLPLTVDPTMQNRRPEDQVPASLNMSISKAISNKQGALQPLASLISQRLESLELEAKAALAVVDQIRQLLPEPEKNHLVSASYQEENLLIRATTPEWCTRIRFHESALREALMAKGAKPFTKLKVRVGR